MRCLSRLCFLLLAMRWLVPADCLGEDSPAVSQATHHQTLLPPEVDDQAVERIRKIVFHQGDNPRALAYLVQLTRNLEAPTAAQLFADLADDYLKQGKYDQAANFLQQLLNQYPTQQVASASLLKLLQLYSSSEINHTQPSSLSSTGGQQAFCTYALHVANNTLPKNSAFNDHPAITLQRAVTSRGANRTQLGQGLLSKLRHNAPVEPWRTYALAEKWLQENREDEPPMPVISCQPVQERPHLDGLLSDPIWQADRSVQFSYDDKFLYLAISTPKDAEQNYEADAEPRTYDADLAGHDHLRLRLDVDRDYATCYELAVDHRGQTNDQCWLDKSWNPKWFVAAGGDDSHWTVEAAIPWEELTEVPPRAGEAWAVAWDRVRAPVAEAPSPGVGAGFSLLLFK